MLLVVWGIKFGCQLWLVGLKAMLRIALEGPQENFYNIIEEEIPLWEGGTKYQFLHANPSRYMSSTSNIFLSNSFNYVFQL